MNSTANILDPSLSRPHYEAACVAFARWHLWTATDAPGREAERQISQARIFAAATNLPACALPILLHLNERHAGPVLDRVLIRLRATGLPADHRKSGWPRAIIE